MSNLVHVRIACPTHATFQIQVELDREYSDIIVGTPFDDLSGRPSRHRVRYLERQWNLCDPSPGANARRQHHSQRRIGPSRPTG